MINKPEVTLILHNIRSTHNVGAIFRTADGFGVKEIILSGYTPYPRTPDDGRLPHIAEKLDKQIHKTALGAEKIVRFAYFENIGDWIKLNAATDNLPIVALEQSENSVMLPEFKPPQKLALLLGEEVNGIGSELLEKCQQIVEIPMFGQKESFNVSVATGIALYGLLF